MNGLSTLNRLLGKRNKDVSKSTSNLSRSTTNLDASSHFNNKVIQLPVVANAPFEQTFRVTVLLPRDQLYVARVGAKTKLSTLLEMVCSDKLLDAQKYVFRHPADFQQGFELDMNIGEVGLSEVRLMSRKELEALRNSDYRLSTSDIFRMHQKSARDTSGGTSVSSSDLSRNSKVPLKTTSPYSSTNSLNSMDSSGVSSSSRGGGGHSGTTNGATSNGHSQMGPPVAPTRKKRLAPRPPSQNSIPEVRSVQQTQHSNGTDDKQHGPDDHIFKEPQLPPYSRQNFHVSTPNLYDRELKSADIINNNNNSPGVNTKNDNSDPNGYAVDVHTNNNNNNVHDAQSKMLEEQDRKNLINTKTSYSTLKNRPTSMYIIREPDPNSTLQRSSENGGSMVDIHHHHSRASSSCSDAKDPRDFQDMPEPTPRKRLNSSAKKSKAPAPPPRAKATITTPSPVPTPSPRALTRSTLDLLRDNDAAISETDSNFSSEPDDTQRNRESRLNAVNGSVHRAPYMHQQQQQNVSKVMLNVEQAPLNDPVVTSTTPNSGEKTHQKNGSTSSVSIKIIGNGNGVTDTPSKPSSTTPIVSKVQISGNQTTSLDQPTSPGDNSSDEEIKIYNIESGKALVKKMSANGMEVEQQNKKATPSGTISNGTKMNDGEKQATEQPNNGTVDEEQWTYKLPAPPTFADSSIKASDYDERGQFYRPASTFVDNTTLRSDMLTVLSDEPTERIEPFIQERLQTMLDLTAGRDTMEPSYYASAIQRSQRPESPASVSTETDATTHVSQDVPHISSDLEDGYRVGENGRRPDGEMNGEPDSTHEAREVWLQTLEKRREKIIEGELATLSESISGGKTASPDDAPSVVRTQSVNERKTSVMSELNQLLREGVELNRKEETEIAVVNRSSLANFKISTYSSSENKENIITSTTTNTTIIEKQSQQQQHIEREDTVTPVVANGDKETHLITDSKELQDDTDVLIVRRKISVDSITVRKPASLTQSSDEDDHIGRPSNGYTASNASVKKELAPVKRRSLTMLNKSPRVINRSDSFHSTRSDYIQSLNSPAQTGTSASGPLHLTPRSTSYISLIGAQRWENRAATSAASLAAANSFANRRKSTSELSICDSPSLQSLEVIKNILNTSRKSSINNLHQTNGSAVEDAPVTNEIVLPSMAAIKRNSFTDISTLVQLNGTGGSKVHMNGVGAVRKDSIEEAKVEQEPEPEPESVLIQECVKPDPKPSVLVKQSADVNKTEDVKKVEKLVEKIVDEPIPQEKVEELIVQKTVEEKIETDDPEWNAKPEISLHDLASESKSDDEKLQNKQQQRQNTHQQPTVVVAKDPQTTVVSITNNSTVVSSSTDNSSATAVTSATNESDTKKWTYQGPPTISFATWNERPKIDVSIKSDRDYRFGGSSTLPRGFRNVNNVSSTKISIGPGGSTTTTTTTVESSSSSNTTGYVRRTIHEVDQQEDVVSNVPSAAVSQARQQEPVSAVVKLPATSPKPATTAATPPGERLPIVRAVEYKKNVAQRQAPPPIEPKPSFLYEPYNSSNSGSNVSSVSINGTVPSVSSIGTNISRLSFGPKPTTVLQPTVRGFKSLDIDPAGSSTGIAAPRLRPVSMIDTSTLRKTTVPLVEDNEAPKSLPFSQNTLRRTGLKDKILATPASLASPVTEATSAKVSVTTTTAAAAPVPVRPISLPMGKDAPIPPPPAPMPPSTGKASQPVVRGAIVKKSPTAPAIDPRTALLDAIRNFNKDSLRKD